jgi:Na+-translocating ferredoxin:NAD+ oxidoreductase subunit G
VNENLPRESPLDPHPPSRSGARAILGLALVAAVAGAIVGLAWDSTRSRIADNEARRTRAELNAILPPGVYDNQPERDVTWLDPGDGVAAPVYRARRNGQPVAAVLTWMAPDGYAGPIRLLVAVDYAGRVLGVRVTAHSETPGIGDAIDARRSDWITGFAGRSFEDPPAAAWGVTQDGGDFDAIAGATYSSRAVVGGVRGALDYFLAHRARIFDAPAISGGGPD